MIQKIYLVHHTHYDIGFTDLAEEVRRQQMGNLDRVIRLCEEDPEYRWTIESGNILRLYLAERSKEQSERMVNLLRSGQIELQAFDMQMLTETASFPELAANVSLSAGLGKKYGFPVECAMLDDIGGFTGCLPRILNEYGVRYLIAGVGACQAELPWADLPHLFFLRSKGGGKILVWNLGIDRTEESTESKYPFAVYGIGAVYLGYRGCREFLGLRDIGIELTMPGESSGSPMNAEEVFDILCKRLEREKYPYEEILLQYGGDNRGPAGFLPELVRKLNATGKYPEIEMVLPRVFFHRMETEYGEKIPEIDGILADPWNLRINAVPSALKRVRAAQRKYEAALMRGQEDPALLESLMLTADHTFGLDNYGWKTKCDASKGGLRAAVFDRVRESWKCKDYYADDAFRRAMELDRKAKNLQISGDAEQIIVWNNAPHEVSGNAELYLGSHAPVLLAVKDIRGREIPVQRTGLNRYQLWVEKVPPLGSAILFPEFSDRYNAAPDTPPSWIQESVKTDFFTLKFDACGNLNGITRKDGTPVFQDDSSCSFGEVLCETIRNYPTGNEHCGLLPASDRTIARGRSVEGGQTEDGELFFSVRQTGLLKNSRFERTVRVWKKQPRIDFSVRLDKPESAEKENYYASFPFNGHDGTFRFDQNAGIADVRDLLPGAMQDLFFCSRYASVEGKEFTAILCCPDAPVVEFGKISTMQWEKSLPFRAESNSIFSLLCNNMCNTDAPAWFPVLDTFSFSLFILDHPFSAVVAQQCWESGVSLDAVLQSPPEPAEFSGVPHEFRVHAEHAGIPWIENLTGNEIPYSIVMRTRTYSGVLKAFELRKMDR